MKNKHKQLKIKKKNQVDDLEALKPNTQELTIKNMIPENILNDKATDELRKVKEKEKNCRHRKINL